MKKIATWRSVESSKKVNSTQKLALVGMFVSLIIVGAFIKFPTPLVPISMQFAFCLLAGLLLGGNLGAVCVLIYITMGLIGLPVFTAGGGIFYIFHPTFGYLIGFVFGVFAAGKLSRIGRREVKSYWQILFASFVAMLIVYAIGVPYLYMIMNVYLDVPTTFGKALLTGFVIFLPTDIMWCVLGSLVAYKMKLLRQKGLSDIEKEEVKRQIEFETEETSAIGKGEAKMQIDLKIDEVVQPKEDRNELAK